MEKIKKLSRRFCLLFNAIFYLVPIFVLSYWILYHTQYDIFSPLGIQIGTDVLSHPVTVNLLSRCLAFGVTLIPTSIMMYGVWLLIQLFTNYSQGKIFELENVRYYHKLGYTLLAWVLIGLVYDALISFVMTFQNKPGLKVIMVSLSGSDIAFLITSGIIILIASIMKEAYKLDKNHSLMI